jgi:hypothetical protein
LRHRRAWIVIGLSFVLLVIYLSLTPHPIDAPSWMNFKLGHILAYAWLMFWYAQVYHSSGPRAAIGFALLAMGIGLEYVQGMVGRDFAYSDMRDDGIGIAIGLTLALTPLGRALELVERKWPA